MNHRHHALPDPWILEHARKKYDPSAGQPMVELIRRLSEKPYAPRVAAFWSMDWFHLAGPMTWNGERFEGEATAFVQIWCGKEGIQVGFFNKSETTPSVLGDIDQSERLVDALVARVLSEPVNP